MTSKLDKREASTGDRAIASAYHREFWPGMLGYVLLLGAALLWGDLDGDSPSRFAWALLPVLPLVWVVFAILRHLRRIDDYQKLLLLRGLGIGFVVAMMTSVTVGFLDIAGLGLMGDGWIIYGAGMFAWLIASAVQRKQ
jgi:hypothetical protein